jgi:hypothetical protein
LVYENAVGGGRADCCALRSPDEERVFAWLPPKGQRSGQDGRGQEVGDSTLLDAEKQDSLSRGRSRPEQLAGAAGQRKLGRRIDWALSPRFIGVRIRIMVEVQTVSVAGGTIRRKLIRRGSFRAPVLHPSEIEAVLQSPEPQKCCLTTPSFSSSGTHRQMSGWRNGYAVPTSAFSAQAGSRQRLWTIELRATHAFQGHARPLACCTAATHFLQPVRRAGRIMPAVADYRIARNARVSRPCAPLSMLYRGHPLSPTGPARRPDHAGEAPAPVLLLQPPTPADLRASSDTASFSFRNIGAKPGSFFPSRNLLTAHKPVPMLAPTSQYAASNMYYVAVV